MTTSITNLTWGGNTHSYYPSVSADGRWVLFQSNASNLISGQTDTNGTAADVFLYDTTTRTTTNLTWGGNGNSYNPSISADGRWATFLSTATNLVSGQADTNGTVADVFVYDTTTHTATNLTLGGNNYSYPPSISGDGRWVTYYSNASNLVSGQTDTNGNNPDVFVYDTTTRTTTNLTLGGNSSSYNPSISADGRWVTFQSYASNLVSGQTDTNGGSSDVFVYDTTTHTTTNLTLGGNNGSYTPSISADGRWVTYYSYASNLVSGQTDTNGSYSDVFVYDTTTHTTTNLTLGGNSYSANPSISADGRWVTFESYSSNLVSGQTDANGSVADVFVYDTTTHTMTNLTPSGNSSSLAPAIAGDGSGVAFIGSANNLVSGQSDTNGAQDIFWAPLGTAAVNHAPTVENALTAQSATEDGAFSFAVPADTFADVDAGDSLTYSATLANGDALPSWLSFNAATRTFSGTPLNANVGSLSVKVTATDAAVEAVSSTFALAVANSNDAPTVANALTAQSATEDSAFSFVVPADTFADVDVGDSLTYTATLANGDALPSWLSFDADSRTFSGTPLNANVGSLSLKVTATDSASTSVSSTFALAVANTNDAPTLSSVTTLGSAAASAFTTSFEEATLPSDLHLDIPNASKATVVLDTVNDELDVTTIGNTDMWGARNNAPIVWMSSPQLAIGQTWSVDTHVRLSYPAAGGQVAGITFYSNADGAQPTVTYGLDDWNPNGRMVHLQGLGNNNPSIHAAIGNVDNLYLRVDVTENGATDKYDFYYKLNAGDNWSLLTSNYNTSFANARTGLFYKTAGSASASFTDFAMSGVGAAEDRPYTITYNDLRAAANEADVDGDTLSFRIGEISSGTLTLNGTAVTSGTLLSSGQSLLWTPAANVNGVLDAFTVKAWDGVAASESDVQVRVNVTAVNDAPTVANALTAQSATEDAAFSFVVPANTFADVDVGDSLTYTATLANGSALPSWLSFNAATQTFSGTPLNANVGNLSVKVIATDSAGAAVSSTFALSVANTNDAPTVANALTAKSATEDTAFSFVVPANTFADVDVGDSLTYTATLANGDALPAWLSFNAATRTFSGTPANGDVGSLGVKVTATDVAGTSASSTFALEVINTNDAPVLTQAPLDQIATEDTAFAITIPADTFFDPDGGDRVTYRVTLTDGSALPSWLSFDATTGELSGTPSAADEAVLAVRVTASDDNGAQSTTDFDLTVNLLPTTPAHPTHIALTQDTGVVGDNLTKASWTGAVLELNTDPTSGRTAVAGERLQVFCDGVQVAMVTLTQSQIDAGVVTVGGGWALGEGNHALSARILGANGRNSATNNDLAFTVDLTAPTVTGSALDNHSDVALGANITATFSEAIRLGSSGQIVIHDDAWSDVRRIDLGSANGQLSVAGNTLTINPTADLQAGKHYQVNLGYGAVTDVAGNAFTGLWDSTTIDFTTQAAIVVPPVTPTPVAPAAPTGVALSVDSGLAGDNLTNSSATGFVVGLSTSGAGAAVAGDIVKIYSGSTQVGQATLTQAQIDAGSVTVSGWGLAAGTQSLSAQVVSSVNGLVSASSHAVSITVDLTAPTLASAALDNQTGVAVSSNLTLAFGEAIRLGSGEIIIANDNGSDVRRIDVANAGGQLSIAGNTLTINPSADLQAGSHYHVTYTHGAVTDVAGNAVDGLWDTTAFDFTTQAAVVVVPPVVVPTGPSAPSGLALAHDTGIVGDNVTADHMTGFVVSFDPAGATAGDRVRLYADGSWVGQAILTQSQVDAGSVTVSSWGLSAGGHQLTATLVGANGVASTSSGALSMTVDRTAPSLTGSALDNATNVAFDANIDVSFSEAISLGTSGRVRVYNDGWTDVRTIDVANAGGQLAVAGDTLTINLTNNLQAGGHYHVSFDYGALTDVTGNAAQGLWDAAAIDFTMSTDTTRPTWLATQAQEGTTLAATDGVTLSFSEAVRLGDGVIQFIPDVGNTITVSLSAGEVSVDATDNHQIHIDPAVDFAAGTAYHVEFSNGVVLDLAGNAVLGNLNDDAQHHVLGFQVV